MYSSNVSSIVKSNKKKVQLVLAVEKCGGSSTNFVFSLLYSTHRRSMEEEAKANSRRSFLGEICRAHFFCKSVWQTN